MAEKSQPITTPIHRSLTRPKFVAGCDRELFILVSLVAVLLIGPGGIMSRSLFNITLGVIVFFVGVALLAWMAKKDALMRQVFMRCVSYKDRYSARSSVTVSEKIASRRQNMRWV